MRKASQSLLLFKGICVLVMIICAQTADVLKNCPATPEEKRNILSENPASLVPREMTFEHSSQYFKNNVVSEFSARVDGTKLRLMVIYGDFNVVQQIQTYATPFEIVGVKNEVCLVKVYSADKSTFTYDIHAYDTGNAGGFEVTVQNKKSLPMTTDSGSNSLAGFQIKKILNYRRGQTLLYLVLSSSTESYLYSLQINTPTLTRIGKIGTSVVDVLGGNQKLLFSKATGKFYGASGANFIEYDITSPLSGKPWYPATTQVQMIQFSFAAYLSTDSATKKGTFLLDKGTGTIEASDVSGTAVVPRMFGDKLFNLIIYSDAGLYWLSFGKESTTATSFLNFDKKVGSGADSLIAQFSTAVSISTNMKNAFVLTPTGMKMYILEKPATDVVITKISDVFLTDKILAIFSAPPGKVFPLSLQCQCATNSAPKLICFSASLNCLMVTRKEFAICTATA